MPILATSRRNEGNDPYAVIFSPDVDSTSSPFSSDVIVTSSVGDGPEMYSKESNAFDESEDAPMRRGPKKQPMTKARHAKVRVRRAKANARERNRMHGLNDALDRLRAHVPCGSQSQHQFTAHQQQKLSKIETLRLARNYIAALADIVATGSRPDHVTFARALTGGLSQNTINLLAACMQLNPRQLITRHASPTAVRYAFWSPDAFHQPLPVRDDYVRSEMLADSTSPFHTQQSSFVASRSANYLGEVVSSSPPASTATGSPISDDFCVCCGAPPPLVTSLPVNGHRHVDSPLSDRHSSPAVSECELNDSGYDGGVFTVDDIDFDLDVSCIESTTGAAHPAGSSFYAQQPTAPAFHH